MLQEMLWFNKIILFCIIVLLFINAQVGRSAKKNNAISNKGKLCTDPYNNFIHHEVTENDITAILGLNNKLRNDVAGGKQNGQPPASKMKRIIWNKDLAKLAKAWAEECNCESSSKKKFKFLKNFPDQGQNVACFMAGPIRKSTPAFNRATYLWFAQMKQCKVDKDNICQGDAATECYNYYQFVSGKNFAIGCGYALCEHNKKQKVWHYVCNYGIGVSMGDKIYKTGEPGSKCRFRDEEYPNLCVPPSISK